MNTKRFIPVALVAAAGLTIAACGGSSGSTPSTPASPPATSAPAVSSTDLYLADLAGLGDSSLNGVSTSTLVGLGQGACSDLNNDGGQLGPVLTDGTNAADQSGLSYTAVGEIIGVAVKDLCPQYRTTVEQQIQADSNS